MIAHFILINLSRLLLIFVCNKDCELVDIFRMNFGWQLHILFPIFNYAANAGIEPPPACASRRFHRLKKRQTTV